MKIGKILSVALDWIVFVLMAVIVSCAEGDTGKILLFMFVIYGKVFTIYRELERKRNENN